MEIKNLLHNQKKFYEEGKTLDFKVRKKYLVALKQAIFQYEQDIYDALFKDLGKSKTEAYMCEIGLVLQELTYQIKHLKKNMKPRKCHSPLSQFKSKCYEVPCPYGNTLILSPWNYPILLSLQPLIGSIAAGNTVILKPSEYSVATSLLLKSLIESVFPQTYVSVVLGDKAVAIEILEYEFDYIFFTGGTEVGRKVYEMASHTLTPVTLELGGKSPGIVDETANLKIAAKRIIFGKFLNAGQTCVAPDYLLVKEEVKDAFIQALIAAIQDLYPNGVKNSDLVHIINEQHFERLCSYLKDTSIVYGGGSDRKSLKIEATLVEAKLDDKIMQEEIFGPILPILTFATFEELTSIIHKNPNPLALYIFSTSKQNIGYATSRISFGGGCINDTVIHLAVKYLSFGGIKTSGLGKYHGKDSFSTFTHYKSMVHKANFPDLPIRYTPYTKKKSKWIRFFIK